MGWPREEDVPPQGPHLHSEHDYSFHPAKGAEPDLLHGPISAQPRGSAAAWYTVYGKPHKDRQGEWDQGIRLAVIGVAAFLTCMRKEL